MTHLIWPENHRQMVILFSLLSIFLISCQSSPVSRHIYPKQGMPLNELISAYGKPHEVNAEYGMEVNRNVWNLSDVRLAATAARRAPQYNVSVSGSQVVTTTSTSSLPEIQQIHCTLVVFTGPDSKVQDWETYGDGCRQILLNEL